MRTKASAIDDFVSNQTVLWGEVCRVGFTEDKVSCMLVRSGLLQDTCVIYRPDADLDFKRGTLDYLLGQTIPFVLLGTDPVTGYLRGSRKIAQRKQKDALLEEISSGREFTASVINLVSYGAFLSVQGVVGLMKHSDYSEDRSEVGESLHIGSALQVRCKEITPEGRIYWEAVRKYRRTEIPAWDFEENTAVVGTVRAIRDLPGGVAVFVRIGTGVDAMCTLPENMDLEENTKVSLRLTKVERQADPWMPPRVRGRILRTIA